MGKQNRQAGFSGLGLDPCSRSTSKTRKRGDAEVCNQSKSQLLLLLCAGHKQRMIRGPSQEPNFKSKFTFSVRCLHHNNDPNSPDVRRDQFRDKSFLITYVVPPLYHNRYC
jgi:hypothetical protein